MCVLSDNYSETGRKQRGIDRLEKAKALVKQEMWTKLENLDRLLIRERKKMKTVDETLAEKVERMNYILEKEVERDTLRMAAFEYEDFIDSIFDERIKRIA